MVTTLRVGAAYLDVIVPDKLEKKREHWWIPYCKELCGLPLHRWHRTCIKCLYRRVYEKKIPVRIPVAWQYTIYVRRGRRWQGIKDWLIKNLLSTVEWLAI